jgi:hypothetical protein
MALPQLTHLAFDDYFLVPVARKMLELSRAIRVLVFFEPPLYSRMWNPEFEAASGQPAWDVRFVLTPRRDMVEDWYAGIQRGTDYLLERRRNLCRGKAPAAGARWCVVSNCLDCLPELVASAALCLEACKPGTSRS